MIEDRLADVFFSVHVDGVEGQHASQLHTRVKMLRLIWCPRRRARLCFGNS